MSISKKFPKQFSKSALGISETVLPPGRNQWTFHFLAFAADFHITSALTAGTAMQLAALLTLLQTMVIQFIIHAAFLRQCGQIILYNIIQICGIHVIPEQAPARLRHEAAPTLQSRQVCEPRTRPLLFQYCRQTPARPAAFAGMCCRQPWLRGAAFRQRRCIHRRKG